MKPFHYEIRSKVPPTVWRYKKGARFEEMPELVDLSGVLPERPGEIDTAFTVDFDRPGLYRVVDAESGVQHVLVGDDAGAGAGAWLTPEEASTLMALVDEGLGVPRLWRFACHQCYGGMEPGLELKPPPAEPEQPSSLIV